MNERRRPGAAASSRPEPDTRRDGVVDVLHGVPVADPYRWLEDGDHPEVVDWVRRQHAAARARLDAVAGRERWLAELDTLVSLPITTAVVARSGVVVRLVRPAGAEQARLVVQHPHRDSPGGVAADRVLVDPAADGETTRAIDWFHLSPDGSLVAYGTSEGGTEDSVLRVVRTVDGSHVGLEIPGTRACSLAWEPDASGFFYTRYPAGAQYDRTVRHHRLGTDPADDPVIWSPRPTAETWAGVELSPDGRSLLVTAMVGWSREDLHLLDVASGRWTTLVEGIEARHAATFGPDGHLLASTTLHAPNGRLVRIPIGPDAGGPGPVVEPADWTTVVPERDVVLGAPVVVGDRVAVTVTSVAVDAVELVDPSTGEVDLVHGLGVVSVAGLDADPVTGTLSAVVTGFDAPSRAYVITADGGRYVATPSVADDVPLATSVPDLEVEIRHATSADGTEVPMFVLRSAGHVDRPDTPLILTGYGGFAISSTPAFSPLAAAWCAAGGVYVVAGLRGGLEHGEAWHEAGRRAHKQRVFEDFEAVADHLVDHGVTSRATLAIAGGSNGGLLVAAALTRRPDAHAAVWCAVPLCDMVRFHRFLIARLWTPEYGDPDVAEEFAWLHEYSPYHRVREGVCYPPTLFTTAEGDTRVDPLHARKMAAAVQGASACTDIHPVLLLQEGRAGHGVGKPRSMRLRELVDVASFFADRIGWSRDR